MTTDASHFPLYGRPDGVVFLDDDPDYLEMLAQVMPSSWPLQCFTSPHACIQTLQAQQALRQNDLWRQQEVINRWRQGASLIRETLHYWRDDPLGRYATVGVCVVDYAMPAMDGLQVLSALQGWTGTRILLTGRADEQLAVQAFNQGLIEQFIPKQSRDMRTRLQAMVDLHHDRPDPARQQIWRASLTQAQDALLNRPDIQPALRALIRQQGWVEWFVIGAPFGILALDAAARVHWLQLEPADKLQELAEMAQAQGWGADQVQSICAGRSLMDLEIPLALGSSHQAQPQPAFALGEAQHTLYGALFTIDAEFGPGAQGSHAQFMAGMATRRATSSASH